MSLLQKLQNNKTAVLATVGGLAAAAGLAYFLKKSGVCCRKESSCQKGASSGCPYKAGSKAASLHERLGGKATIAVVVKNFYKKVLADDRVKRFFENTNMNHQEQQQTNFLCMAFGGANEYKGKNMKEGHAGMQINYAQFDAIVELLAATLSEAGVAASVIQEIADICVPLKDDICEIHE